MGEELSDPGSYDTDGADSRDAPKRGEWRTPPLWGFRDTAPYLHDGRARNLEEAVALHHGQGAASASQFRSMSDLRLQNTQRFDEFEASMDGLHGEKGCPAAPFPARYHH